MPQLDLWGAPAARIVTWSYSTDPLHPERQAAFYVMLTGKRGEVIEHGMTYVPGNVVHEMVDDLLEQTWMAYLFGEPGDVRTVIGSRRRAWLEESKHRPSF